MTKTAPDMNLFRQILRALPHTRPPRLPHVCGPIGGATLVLVDGNEVKLRSRKNPKSSHVGEPDFMDFVEGGNGLEDPELCPKDQVWVDALIDPVCWPFIAYHEETEREHMARGLSYDKAHAIANRQEKQLRLRYHNS